MLDLGQETTVTVKGREFTFSRLFISISDGFAKWVREQVGDPYALVERLWDKLSEEERKVRLADADALRDQLECFTMASPLAEKWIKNERGTARLAKLMLQQHHPDISDDEAFAVCMAIGPEFGNILHRAQGKPLPTDPKDQPAPES